MSDPKEPPTRFCDLVMKGGVTSGVVYPLAAVALSKEFIFKSIGGTSAGAIAAAATAVAESNRAEGGFEKLKELPDFLTEKVAGGSGSNLFAFFQPQPGTRRLFKICVAGLGGGVVASLKVALQVALSYLPLVLVGAAPGAYFLHVASGHASGPFLDACFVAGAIVIAVGVVAGAVLGVLFDVAVGLPRNFYGMCTGMSKGFYDGVSPGPGKKGMPLTAWLNAYFIDYYKLGHREHPVFGDRPVIFRDLWGTSNPAEDCAVRLEMMTTCLTHGRPYQLPFRQDDVVKENSMFYFRREEFERLFPKTVVDWMASNPRAVHEVRDEAWENALLAKGFLRLPEPANMPVVVAVRMSLSFPVLLSAVPLHAIDRSCDPEGLNPERCWFSDGGVCSNFPIHFFDAPIPKWPTLGINLVDKPARTPDARLLQPEMPRNNADGIQESWNRFEFNQRFDTDTGQVVSKKKSGLGRVASFGGAFLSTMQNWTDSVQSRLPGYRDRIASVGLTPDEGGLNLNMPKPLIDVLSARGDAAGLEFIRRFGTPPGEPKMTWANHRWLRMRSCLASVEEFLASFEDVCAHPQAGDIPYEVWVAETPPAAAPGYDWKRDPWDASKSDQRDVALGVIRALRQTAVNLKGPTNLLKGSPKPRPELRPKPRL